MKRIHALAAALVFGTSGLVLACSGGGEGGASVAPPQVAPPAMPEAGPTESPEPSAVCPEGHRFTKLGNKIVMPATVAGRPMKVIYDSGAPETWVAQSLASTVGRGAVTVAFAGRTVELPHVTFGAIPALPGVDAVIGSDVVAELVVTVDYPRSRLWLDEKLDEKTLLACDHVEGAPAIVDVTMDGYMFVRGKLESLEGWFLVDTGATFGVVPKRVFAELTARAPRATLTGFHTPAAVGTFWADFAMVGSMQTGDRAVGDILVRTVDDGMIGPAPTNDAPLLGVLPHDYLSRFLVTLDLPHGKLRLDRVKAGANVGATRYWTSGISLEATTGAPVHVTSVLPGSAAAEQGVVAGDEVTALDGVAIAAVAPFDRPWRLLTRDAAGTVAVTVLHEGGAPRELALDTRDLLVAPR